MPSASALHDQDEHMTHYEWCGAGTGGAVAPPQREQRADSWHASYAVLALLTTLLLVQVGGSKAAAEAAGPAGEPRPGRHA
jgi:hypothetical protein